MARLSTFHNIATSKASLTRDDFQVFENFLRIENQSVLFKHMQLELNNGTVIVCNKIPQNMCLEGVVIETLKHKR